MARKQTATQYEEDVVDQDDSVSEQPSPKELITTVLVRGSSALPATQPEGKRYGHWRAGLHWPGSGQAEVRVSIQQLDELKEDPNLSLVYDPTEEAVARTNIAPDVASRTAAMQAAELELQAAELHARAAVLAAQAAAIEADKSLQAKRDQVASLRGK